MGFPYNAKRESSMFEDIVAFDEVEHKPNQLLRVYGELVALCKL